MNRRSRSLAAAAATLLAASIPLACAKRGDAPAAEPTAAAPAAAAAESRDLGLRIASLPAGFSSPNELGGSLQLRADLEGVEGSAILRVLEGAGPINLVEEAKGYGAAAETAGGKFFGGSELVTPSGPAYAARILADQGTAEERRVFMLHPDGSERLLQVTLRYPPASDEVSRSRLQQLLELVAAIEPLPATP